MAFLVPLGPVGFLPQYPHTQGTEPLLLAPLPNNDGLSFHFLPGLGRKFHAANHFPAPLLRCPGPFVPPSVHTKGSSE